MQLCCAAQLEAVRQQPSARSRRLACDGGRDKQAHQWENAAMGHGASSRMGEVTWTTQFYKLQMGALRSRLVGPVMTAPCRGRGEIGITY